LAALASALASKWASGAGESSPPAGPQGLHKHQTLAAPSAAKNLASVQKQTTAESPNLLLTIPKVLGPRCRGLPAPRQMTKTMMKKPRSHDSEVKQPRPSSSEQQPNHVQPLPGARAFSAVGAAAATESSSSESPSVPDALPPRGRRLSPSRRCRPYLRESATATGCAATIRHRQNPSCFAPQSGQQQQRRPRLQPKAADSVERKRNREIRLQNSGVAEMKLPPASCRSGWRTVCCITNQERAEEQATCATLASALAWEQFSSLLKRKSAAGQGSQKPELIGSCHVAAALRLDEMHSAASVLPRCVVNRAWNPITAQRQLRRRIGRAAITVSIRRWPSAGRHGGVATASHKKKRKPDHPVKKSPRPTPPAAALRQCQQRPPPVASPPICIASGERQLDAADVAAPAAPGRRPHPPTDCVRLPATTTCRPRLILSAASDDASQSDPRQFWAARTKRNSSGFLGASTVAAASAPPPAPAAATAGRMCSNSKPVKPAKQPAKSKPQRMQLPSRCRQLPAQHQQVSKLSRQEAAAAAKQATTKKSPHVASSLRFLPASLRSSGRSKMAESTTAQQQASLPPAQQQQQAAAAALQQQRRSQSLPDTFISPYSPPLTPATPTRCIIPTPSCRSTRLAYPFAHHHLAASASFTITLLPRCPAADRLRLLLPRGDRDLRLATRIGRLATTLSERWTFMAQQQATAAADHHHHPQARCTAPAQ
uniref:Protein kinase domain-containing protein n=1 Tax=Macrostomum lignano TaxID=282301 RepID=A0A1I8FIA3_9PLAT